MVPNWNCRPDNRKDTILPAQPMAPKKMFIVSGLVSLIEILIKYDR